MKDRADIPVGFEHSDRAPGGCRVRAADPREATQTKMKIGRSRRTFSIRFSHFQGVTFIITTPCDGTFAPYVPVNLAQILFRPQIANVRGKMRGIAELFPRNEIWQSRQHRD